MNAMTSSELLRRAIVWTPDVQGALDAVAQWVRLERPGGIIHGPHWCGKTTTLNGYLPQTIADSAGVSVACVNLLAPRGAASERELLQAVLLQARTESVGNRDVAVLRHRLVRSLSGPALEAAADRLLVCIDEAQWLTQANLHTFLHCAQSLEAMGIKTILLLAVPVHACAALDTMRACEPSEALRRILACRHEMKGLEIAAIPDVLEQFDRAWELCAREYPETRMPAGYGLAWCIRDLATAIQHGLELLSERHRLGNALRVPIGYLRLAVIGLIDRVACAGVPAAGSSAAIEAFGEAGLLDLLATQQADPARSRR